MSCHHLEYVEYWDKSGRFVVDKTVIFYVCRRRERMRTGTVGNIIKYLYREKTINNMVIC